MAARQPPCTRQPPRPFGLDDLTHGGLAGWAVACQDIDAAVTKARRGGYDPGEVADMQRASQRGQCCGGG